MVSHDCACCVDYNCIANCCQVALSASLKTRFLFIYCCTWLRLKISDDFFFFFSSHTWPRHFSFNAYRVLHSEFPPPSWIPQYITFRIIALSPFCTGSFSTANLYFHPLCSGPQNLFLWHPDQFFIFKRFNTSYFLWHFSLFGLVCTAVFYFLVICCFVQ